jgi:acetyl esterase/lipase
VSGPRPGRGRARVAFFLLLVPVLVPADTAPAANAEGVTGPESAVYATRDGRDLEVHVFRPDPDGPAARPAIVIFHGGGWFMGEPSWGFGRASHFAGHGMVAVVPRFRLSNQGSTTPIEAMADARDVLRWVRSRADSLGVDPLRIAAYGWSSGGHLAASTAVFPDSGSADTVRASPDALVLICPAVNLETDAWARKLVGDRADIADISPASHVRPGLPPTLVLGATEDTVTPPEGVKRFCERMEAEGNRCELHVYPDVGHLFTPAGIPDNAWPKPDPAVQADAYARVDAFLTALGFYDAE